MDYSGRTLLGRFKVEKALGFGGMSEVVLARDLALAVDVALKIIHPHLLKNPRTIERFRREVEICRMIAHPGIAMVRELYESPEEGLLFLSMEYLPGGDLETRIIKEGKLSESELRMIAVPLLESLDAAHTIGIVHRDIKPHNILFDARGKPRLTDFGLARIGFGESGREGVVGTPEYCPPESAAGRHVDQRGDIYSLGLTLYEAATGKLPFSANDPLVLLSMKTREDAPKLRRLSPSCSEGLERIISKALARDPEERFQTAREFRDAIAGIPSGETFTISSFRGPERGTMPLLCPICGEELPKSLSFCFHCGKAVPSIEAAIEVGKGDSVVVLGSGKPGDKLSPQEREACLSLVQSDGVDAGKLKKKIPRLPFTLVRGLSAASAEGLVSSLVSRGIGAISSGSRNKEGKKASLKAFSKKVLALSPRIFLIALGSMGSFYGNIWRIFSRRGGLEAISILFVLMLLIAPGAIALGNLSTYAKIKGGQKKRFRWSVLGTALSLDLPAFRDLAVSFAKKLDALSELLDAEGILPSDIEPEFRDTVGAGLSEWAETILETQETERTLVSSSELYEDEIGIQERRKMEMLVDAGYSKILRLVSAFDALIVKLSSMRNSMIGNEINAIAKMGTELGDFRKALQEIDGASQGGSA